MKCICVAGAVQTDLDRVFSILQQVGVKSPIAIQRIDSIDISSWHEQALNLDVSVESIGSSRLNLGRFMDQMASDIFVANIKSTAWGWADTRSTELLDYWLAFDPRINFVLVYISPEQMLAHAISSSTENISVEDILAAWQSHNQQLLRFHLRNPKRSMLIDGFEAIAKPQALLNLCAQQWSLKLAPYPVRYVSFKTNEDTLALYLAKQLCLAYTEVDDLSNEITATMFRPSNVEPTTSNSSSLVGEDLIKSYRALQDRTAELKQLDDKEEELSALKVSIGKQKKQKEQDDLKLRALIQAHDEQVRSQQLQVDCLTQAVDDYAKQVNELTDIHISYQEETESRLKVSVQENESKEQENELLLLQLHQVQEELESYFLQHQDKQTQLEALTQAKASADQENELLLLQLHQVQEELEHYFLQHQDKQNALQVEAARWQRMLQRNPDYCDYESIKVLPKQNSQDNRIVWQFQNLHIAGRSFRELTFETITEKGLTGFIFTKPASKEAVFTRWPVTKVIENELIIMPCGEGDQLVQSIEILVNLSASDWVFLKALIRLLDTLLQQPKILQLSADENLQMIGNGLKVFQDILQKFPPLLRYDQVTLKRAQVNPDYEHLWLQLENLVFADKASPEFSFRLSCANVGPNRFGGYPKLEFPETVEPNLFEGWFIESYDDFGGKLELRFALPKAMDIEVWQRLTDHDRKFLVELLERLPSMLAVLQHSNTQLKRPWGDWLTMIKEMQVIIAPHIKPQQLVSKTPKPGAKKEMPIDQAQVKTKEQSKLQPKKVTPTTAKGASTTKSATLK